MKRIALTLIGAVIMLTASAQIGKGVILVGASSNFGANSYNPDTGAGTSTLNLDLKGGYFIIDNLAVGVRVDYTKVSASTDFSTTVVGIFGRYYINGKIFAGLGVNSVSSSGGASSTTLPIEVGYAAFITNNITIEPSLAYAKGDGYDTFGLNVGFNIYFNRK